jgi:hypothetical protein
LTSGTASIDTVADALGLLRARYSGLLEDVGSAERVLWVGAGVSRDQVPDVEQLLRKVLSFLRDHIVAGDANDPHAEALERIVARHLPEEVDRFRAELTGWTIPDDLKALTGSYSDILGEDVAGKPQDYLVWEAINVRETYGSPDLAPGPEHILIALLIHEGVISSITSTNWDGLIERAVADTSPAGSPPLLAVLMSNDSFREERGACTLYKPHGCAVLAREDSTFRQYIVARTTDIAAWHSAPIYGSMVERLRSLARTRRSLMLGSSVQDYNLLTQIATASQVQPWPWQSDNPAYLFAEPEIVPSQRDVLKVAYKDDYAANRDEICGGSATGTYSGLLLGATALHVVMEKLQLGIDHASSFAGSGAVVADLRSGLSHIENQIIGGIGSDLSRLVDVLRSGFSALVNRFFDPANDLMNDNYVPIYSRPLRLGVDLHYRSLRLPELSVALGLLGLGSKHGHWSLDIGTGGVSDRGMVSLVSAHGRPGGGAVKVVVTCDAVATSAFKGHVTWSDDPADVLVIQATGDRPKSIVRGLGGGIGSGRSGPRPRREMWLSDLVRDAGDPVRLLDSFRAEVSA